MPGMTQGAVDRTTINPATGAAGSATGLSATFYAAAVAYFGALPTPQPPPAPTVGQTTYPFTEARPADAQDVTDGLAGRLMVFQFWADLSNVFASAVPYLKANAVAVVTTQSLGLTPNPNNPSTAIVGPGSGAPVTIPIE